MGTSVLEHAQEEQLSILRLRASAFEEQDDSATRHSDASSSFIEKLSPSSVETDLRHYKDLFSKLRFSYIEQVTKEKFLRSVTSSPPTLVEAEENSLLEKELASQKTLLQEQKSSVSQHLTTLTHQARTLTQRYETILSRQTDLETLPMQIQELEECLAVLRESEKVAEDDSAENENPFMRLPLDQTLDLMNHRAAQNQLLDEQLDAVNAALPRKVTDLAALQRAVSVLEHEKHAAIATAKELRHIREEGGMSELEEKGRWLSASNRTLSAWLEVE